MFRLRSLFSLSIIGQLLAASLVQTAYAQSSQYSAQSTQLALATPSAVNGLQMLRAEASVLYSSGQYVAAADSYRRLIQLGSLEASDRYWLGESLYHAKSFAAAASAFEQAIQINPKLEQSYARLTETYLVLRQKDKARQVCDNALRVVSDPYAHQQLEMLLKVSSHQERKPTRSGEVRPAHMPAES
jgi:tetratricopeptide (TPR) repeat protein